jgi:hypothetical protein
MRSGLFKLRKNLIKVEEMMKKILVVSIMALGLAMLSPSAHAVIPGLEGMGIEVGVGLEHASRRWEGAGIRGESTVLGFWAQPTIEVMEGLDVYLKLGMASIKFKRTLPTPVTFDGGMDLGWGLGVRYIMPMGGLGLPGRRPPGRRLLPGLEGIGEALEVGVGFDWINLTSDHKAVKAYHRGTLKMSGWRLSLFAREDMGMFVPYVGLRYSDMTLRRAAERYHPAHKFGIFLGADIPMDFANINVELGLLDETSFRVGAKFAF